jgi:hypothetical protein
MMAWAISIYAAHAQWHFLQWSRHGAFHPIADDRLTGTARERAAGPALFDFESGRSLYGRHVK